MFEKIKQGRGFFH